MVGVSGNELSCRSVVPPWSGWCDMALNRLYTALEQSLSTVGMLLTSVPLSRFKRQTTAGGLKGGFLCSRVKLSFAAASQLPARSDL